MAELAEFTDFMDDADGDGGFDSPRMPSPAHPQGRSYRIPSPDAKTGLRLTALADMSLKQSRGIAIDELDVKRLRISDDDEREFLGQVLSPGVLEQMIEDGVKWEHARRLAMYAFVRFGISKDAADEAAKNGLLSGKAAAPNRAARRTKKKKSTTSASPGSKKTRAQS